MGTLVNIPLHFLERQRLLFNLLFIDSHVQCTLGHCACSDVREMSVTAEVTLQKMVEMVGVVP